MKTVKGIRLLVLQLIVLLCLTNAASAQLHAGFSATPVTGCPPVLVTFKDVSTGNPTAWKWDLGNGTISYLQDPVVTYFNPGTYNIKLVVTNASGADSIVKTKYIVVNAPPVPVFGASDTAGCFPLKVQFTDSSSAGSGVISQWQWDFGDGTLSNDQNPAHTYTNSGIYTVILRIVNSNGCSQVITKSSYIKVPNGVKAQFSYVSGKGCKPPAPVTFTNETKGTDSLHYTWDFGDGNTSNEVNPLHNYAGTGVFSIRLIAANDYGCTDTLQKDNAINIGYVQASFTSPTTICAGTNFQLTNSSNPATYVGVKWDFGDSTFSTVASPTKSFVKEGTYNVKLVTDFGLCQDSLIKVIDVLPRPTAGFTGSNNIACKAPLTVAFTNSSDPGATYKWNFGDGTTSTVKNPSHTYTTGGNKTVTLVVTNASGCTDSIVKKDFVKIAPPEISLLKGLMVKGCIPLVVKPVAEFTDSIPVASYLWNFGDGTTSTEATPSHTYTTPGSFTVRLKITTESGCSDSITIADAVNAGNKPTSSFVADPTDVCAFAPVYFTDSSTNGPIHEWFWTFGDGGTSVEQNPIHAYMDTGYFDVTMVAYSFGCADTLQRLGYIHIKPPIAKFDTSYICSDPLKRIFINKSIGATTYNWDFGDGASSTD